MTENNITETLRTLAFELGADFISITDKSCFEDSDYTGNRP
jgi:hypothetical protein